MDHSRRQAVLQHLNSRLQSTGKLSLGVTGSKLPLLHSSVPMLKPSRIPRPASPSRPLPPPGYVSESITAHSHGVVQPITTSTQGAIPQKTTTTHPSQSTSLTLANDDYSRDRTTSEHMRPPRKQLTIVLHGIGNPLDQPEQRNKSSKLRPESKQDTLSNQRGGKKRTRSRGEAMKAGGVPRTRPVRAGKVGGNPPHTKACDWSKGGRLNELRIRCLARKYSRVWMSCVFGRVHPAIARACHTRSLMRKMFCVWYEEWWVSRREWKLTIRAECHDRYRLWQLVWIAWTGYTLISRDKNRKRQTADQFAYTHLTQVVWKNWQKYTRVRREKNVVRRQTDQWRCSQIVRSTWLRWKRALESRRERKAMETLALYHWAHRLTDNVWHSWLERLHTGQVSRLQEGVAWHHRSRTLLLSSWDAWTHYVHCRQHKLEMRRLAMTLYTSRLVAKTFVCWRVRFDRVREIAKFQELIEEKGRIVKIRRCFQHWRFYITLRLYKVTQQEQASMFYRLALKTRAFVSIRVYLVQQHREASNKQMACQHQVRQLVCQCWLKWLRGCEHREEMKMGPQTRIAQNHFSSKATRKVLVGWVKYTLHHRQRKLLCAMADNHFKNTALPKCFAALQENVQIQLYESELKQTAASFRRETLLSMAFYKLWRESQFSQDMRMLERVAILHDEQVKKKNLLKLWQIRTRERVRHLAQEATAVSHYRLRMMSTVFDKWSFRKKAVISRKQRIQQAVSHHDNQVVGAVWSAWIKYVSKRRLSKEKGSIADRHFQKVVTHYILHAWKVYHSQEKVKQAKVLSATHLFHTTLKRRVMSCWSKCAEICKMRRQLKTRADGLCQAATLRKYFIRWHVRTAATVEACQIEDERVAELCLLLEEAKLSRIISHWREYADRCVIVRLTSKTADSHHSMAVRRRCFNAWWEYHRGRLRKELLTGQSVWFTRTRLVSCYYSKWRVQFMGALVTKQKSTLSLWHWSQTLQRKAVVAWLFHTLDRKRKRERYSVAMDRHRTRLLNIGVTQWIKVATQIQAQREEIALHQQAKSAHTVLKCVRRCATHWKALTRKRRSSHLSLPPNISLPNPHSYKLGEKPINQQATSTWNTLMRNLHLPDGQSRPQPRRLRLATQPLPSVVQSHPLHDALPRQPLHPASHKPSHEQRVTTEHLANQGHRTEDSFTFLTSTCSEGEPTENSDTIPSCVSRETYIVGDNSPSCPGPVLGCSQSIHSQDCHPAPHDDRFLTDIWRPNEKQVTSNRGSLACQPQLVCHTQATLSRSDSHCKSRGMETNIQTSYPHNSGGLPSSLTGSAVQIEIIKMRDTLKYFHQLKAHQKLLEGKLSSLISRGNSEELHQVRQELQSISQNILSWEPMIKKIALRINELVIQSGLTQ